MSRKQKKYHYIYKTTCKITGKFYVGMHSSDSLEDGYLGSGKILGYSRAKYGDENHTREILEICVTREQLRSREKEIVNEEMLKDPLNINLKYGGEGGWDHVDGSHLTKEMRKEFGRRGGLISGIVMGPKNLIFLHSKESRNKANKTKINRYGNLSGMLNKKHSKESKEKMSESHSGSKNSQYGKCWINHPELGSKSIDKNLLESFLLDGWIKGRKLK